MAANKSPDMIVTNRTISGHNPFGVWTADCHITAVWKTRVLGEESLSFGDAPLNFGSSVGSTPEARRKRLSPRLTRDSGRPPTNLPSTTMKVSASRDTKPQFKTLQAWNPGLFCRKFLQYVLPRGAIAWIYR